MKRISTLFFILFFLSTTMTFGQAGTTITYSDNVSPGGLTLNYNNLINGKHSYKTNVDDLTIFWSGTRWEITVVISGTTFLIAHSDAVTLGISPPTTAVGGYVIDDPGTTFVTVV